MIIQLVKQKITFKSTCKVITNIFKKGIIIAYNQVFWKCDFCPTSIREWWNAPTLDIFLLLSHQNVLYINFYFKDNFLETLADNSTKFNFHETFIQFPSRHPFMFNIGCFSWRKLSQGFFCHPDVFSFGWNQCFVLLTGYKLFVVKYLNIHKMQANKPLRTDTDHSKKHSVEFIVIYAGKRLTLTH